MNFISIDLDNEIPVFAQLVAGIKEALGDGRVSPGDKLPSIRQLSSDLQINPKTVSKAYQRLERDRIIISKGYRGSFIRDDAKSGFSRQLETEIVEELEFVIRRLKEKGAEDSELRRAFTALLKTIGS